MSAKTWIPVLFLLITLNCGCREVRLYAFAKENADKVAGEVDAEAAADALPAADWIDFTASELSFKHPADWRVETRDFSADSSSSARRLVILKDTTKEIVSGAFAPADFYTETANGDWQNTTRYPDSYAAISLTAYPDFSERSWEGFFSEIEPETVADFENVRLPDRPELDAVQVTRVSGLFPGDARIFIRGERAIYDISLNFRNRDEAGTLTIFKTFLGNLGI